jgi:2-oxoglutarate dehydrogenase E2 component (dihydrolipoamide succinyltransferase)
MDITVPAVGESITDGVLASWLKEDGSQVAEGDDLFELETDKATLAVPAPASGVLHVSVAEDEEVEIGQVVGTIDTEAAGQTPAAAEAGPEKPAPAESETPAAEAGKEAGAPAAERPAAGKATPAKDGPADAAVQDQGSDKLSPAVRRIVEEEGLDAGSITGTGPGGRITKEDALGAAAAKESAATKKAGGTGAHAGNQAATQAGGQPAPSGPAPGAPASAQASGAQAPEAPASQQGKQERVKLSNLRKRIAANLVASKQNAAHLTTFNEVDMSAIMTLRKENRDAFEAKFGVRLGFMSFFVKAAVAALGDYPEVNAYLEEEAVVYNRFYNIGVAVSTERGLLVPVLRDADLKSFAQIEEEIVSFGRRAQEKKLTPDELTGGTFTISNGGVFGSLMSTPIPNPPQTAVMGMHTIQQRPVAVDNQVVIRPMMYLALTYDHRLIDGREAVGFLATIKRLVEDPARLMLGL